MNFEIVDKLKIITEEEKNILAGRNGIDASIYQFDVPTDLFRIDSRKLLEAGKLITIRPNTRFVHFPPHRHNYVEVMYMCEGMTTHIINGNKVELKKGELLFLSQNAVQEIMPAKEDDIGVNFIILPEFFNYALGMLSDEESILRTFLFDCLTGKNEDISYLHFKVAKVLPVQNLVENLIWTIINHQQGKRSINEITMGLLLLQLTSYMDAVETNKYGFGQKLILQVLGYIEANYRSGELKELAKKLNYDMVFLSKMIKKHFGATYTELVQAKRLQQGTYLLTHTALSVSEIAAAVGYENTGYFHRVFQKKYEMTPGKYRARYAKT